jgi:hypothetical protein
MQIPPAAAAGAAAAGAAAAAAAMFSTHRVKVSRLFWFCLYLQRRVCQRAALQARFRRRTSKLPAVVLTLLCESTLR